MRLLLNLVSLLAVVALVITAMTYVMRAIVLVRGGPWPQPEPVGWIDGGASLLCEWASLGLALLLSLLLLPVPRRRGGEAPRTAVLVSERGLGAGSLFVLGERLRRDGWNVVSFSPGWDGVTATAQRLQQLLQDQPGEGERVVLGHGLGGVAARYCCRFAPDPRVRRVLTLGSPYRGSELGWFPYHPELRPGSPLLRELNSAGPPPGIEVIALHSRFDAFVLPPVNALNPTAFNIQVQGVGHFSLLYSVKVFELIAENLQAATRGPETLLPRRS